MKTDQSIQFTGSDGLADNTESISFSNGKMEYTGNLKITGIFTGMLDLKGNLTVGEHACIIGNVSVNDLIVHGRMQGTAWVKNKAFFHAGSSFSGSLFAKEAEIREGSIMSGKKILGWIAPELILETPDKPKKTPVIVKNTVPVKRKFRLFRPLEEEY